MKDRIKTSVSELILEDDNIVRMKFDKNVSINFDQSREIFFGRMKFNTPSEKQLLLVDLRCNPRLDKSARDYAKSNEVRRSTRAMAIMTDDHFAFVLKRLFLGEHKVDFPVKVFSDEVKARNWLLSHELVAMD